MVKVFFIIVFVNNVGRGGIFFKVNFIIISVGNNVYFVMVKLFFNVLVIFVIFVNEMF